MSDKFRETFIVEVHELLDELQNALLDLEAEPDNADIIGRIFRAMHTIKGSGSMFGFDKIAAFTHDIETFYDMVRNGKILVSKLVIDLTLKACDQIAAMVESSDSMENADAKSIESITQAFRSLINSAGECTQKTGDMNNHPKSGVAEKEKVYRIRFKPARGLFADGTNPIPLFDEISSLGDYRITAHTDSIPPLQELNPEECFTAWEILLTTSCSIDAIRDVFIFINDVSGLQIDEIDSAVCDDGNAPPKKLGEILIDRGDIQSEDLAAVLKTHKRIGEDIADAGLAPLDAIKAARAEQQHLEELQRKNQSADRLSSIRVPAGKLDDLVNMVGELVTVQSRLSQQSARLDDPDLLQISEEVKRLISDLRENAMSIRMLPIGATFNKFIRLVRDLSRELNKEITLLTKGDETELDKTVIERLNDPLIHLIRNAIDHGIELPALREQSGKSRQGTICLSAEHSGAHVLIRICDDGSGLNREAIRTKALERNLIAPDAALTDKELLSLILQPGFSTAKTISNISGRGVGMDVVKKNIEALNGTIDIQSESGKGTTVTLRLPLTLAIIDGLLVRIEQQYFVLSLSVVEECVEMSRKKLMQTGGQHVVSIRDEIVPYIRLRDQFAIAGDPPQLEQIVIANVEGYRLGLMVDQVIGEYQTVIKSLGRMYRTVEEISGATILGDGHLALILDLPKLFKKVENEELHNNQPLHIAS